MKLHWLMGGGAMLVLFISVVGAQRLCSIGRDPVTTVEPCSSAFCTGWVAWNPLLGNSSYLPSCDNGQFGATWCTSDSITLICGRVGLCCTESNCNSAANYSRRVAALPFITCNVGVAPSLGTIPAYGRDAVCVAVTVNCASNSVYVPMYCTDEQAANASLVTAYLQSSSSCSAYPSNSSASPRELFTKGHVVMACSENNCNTVAAFSAFQLGVTTSGSSGSGSTTMMMMTNIWLAVSILLGLMIAQ